VKAPRFHLSADRSGLQLTFDDTFWNDAVRASDRASTLDYNIAYIVEEIRAALYTVARYSSYDSEAHRNN
jgi:hypothetical protein